ncbi:hypothetical protein BU24DRAFT_425917 [Aaosphaeria arxii CBS 175.79]|uniref:Uncharacterized protein n=1 Tax=Aaosphaeria arxii CBS 175.79 TaxID=1450172 RepID=A0A6A5XGT8_9PLEO|nr:uncharacterized protein BU24DRAFT_425917 [Aaosphaeria arxii CBS 175.79]KAF2012079.1 hypothetical protein BU24DRAFT_425917 [Aaosphaeria arxii CBS 175.79]
MEDRGVALRMSKDDPDLEAPPPYTEDIRNEYLEDEVLRRLKLLLLSDETSYDDNESEIGPSAPYTQRQAEALGKVSHQNFECCACLSESLGGSLNQSLTPRSILTIISTQLPPSFLTNMDDPNASGPSKVKLKRISMALENCSAYVRSRGMLGHSTTTR